LNNYVQNIPSGRNIRREVGDDVIKAADSVQLKTQQLIALKRDVHRLADSELSQSNVTPELTNQINAIKQQAAELAVKGGNDLAESMQAVTDWLL